MCRYTRIPQHLVSNFEFCENLCNGTIYDLRAQFNFCPIFHIFLASLTKSSTASVQKDVVPKCEFE